MVFRLNLGPDGTLPQLLGPGQEFMACVVGAGLLGFGIGIVFCNNGSTGGTDIIAWIINKSVVYTNGLYNNHYEYSFFIGALCLLIAVAITKFIKE